MAPLSAALSPRNTGDTGASRNGKAENTHRTHNHGSSKGSERGASSAYMPPTKEAGFLIKNFFN